jgi:hypothetical protein
MFREGDTVRVVGERDLFKVAIDLQIPPVGVYHLISERDPEHQVVTNALRMAPGGSPVDPTDNQYLVKALVDRRLGPNGEEEFLVQWAGYPDSFNGWVPTKDIYPALVRAFFWL